MLSVTDPVAESDDGAAKNVECFFEFDGRRPVSGPDRAAGGGRVR